jgi:hypothetical protein
MDPVILKVTSTMRMIPVRGIVVRTPCEIKVTNETELTFFENFLQSQGLLYEKKVQEKKVEKKPAPRAPRKRTPAKKKVDATTPKKPESTLDKLTNDDEE